jgi:hypothetical protein
VAVHRGILLLWLTVVSLASWAIADDENPLVTQSEAVDSAEALLQPSESPLEPQPLPGPRRRGSRSGHAVQQARYIAQHPRPDEPLGFSNTLMAPTGSPVDPAETPGIFEEAPVEDTSDPLDLDAPAPTVSSGAWLRDGCWYTQQSAVFMSRSTNTKNSVNLATDLSSAVIAHDRNFLQIPIDMGFQPGLRSTWGHYLGRDARNRDHAVEFTYLGLTHWQSAASVTAHTPAAIFSEIDPTFTVPAFNASNFQSFAQTSNFNSYELNYRIERRLSRDRLVYTRDSTWVRQATPAPLPSVFAGLRVVTVNERLNYLAQSSSANGSYNIATHNSLVGLQIGTDWFYEQGEWRLGARVKGGGFVNWDNQTSQVRILDLNGVPLLPNRDEHAKDHPLAFVGEISFIGSYRFRPNFAFRTSYDLMWVTDQALAQNQITFSPTTPALIADHHSLFYQGVSVGFELCR